MLFSDKQLDRCYHLLSEHNYDVNQVADVLDITIRQSHQIIKQARQKYPDNKSKHFYSNYKNKEDPKVFTRPKAVYSNQRIYDLI